jgi:hypothetical protein
MKKGSPVMNSFKSTKSVLMLGALALGGLVALAAPASADDYDNHGASAIVGQPYVPSGVRVINVPLAAGSYDDNHGNNTIVVPDRASARASDMVVDAATRRARSAAEDEAKRLQQ